MKHHYLYIKHIISIVLVSNYEMKAEVIGALLDNLVTNKSIDLNMKIQKQSFKKKSCQSMVSIRYVNVSTSTFLYKKN